MKNYPNYSENFIRHLIHSLKQMIQELLASDFVFDRRQLRTELQVAELLGVSERTMRTYRSSKLFHYIKLEGRIYYLGIILYMDLIVHSLHNVL